MFNLTACISLLALLAVTPTPTGTIPSINAKVKSFQFFEGPSDPPPKEKRVYTTRFEKQKTRYVYWELDLQFPASDGRQFTMDEFWYDPGGQVIRRQQAYGNLEKGWTFSHHNHGYGFDGAGQLPVGKYRVDILVELKNVASGTFEIYDPVPPEKHYAEGKEHLDKGQYDEAITQLTYAIEANPKYAEAYIARGQAFVKKSHFKEAIKDFGKLTEIKPQDSTGYRSRAEVYLLQGETFKALSDLDQAIKVNDQDAPAYVMRGSIYRKQKLYDQALQDLEKAQSLGYQVDPQILQELRNNVQQ